MRRAPDWIEAVFDRGNLFLVPSLRPLLARAGPTTLPQSPSSRPTAKQTFVSLPRRPDGRLLPTLWNNYSGNCKTRVQVTTARIIPICSPPLRGGPGCSRRARSLSFTSSSSRRSSPRLGSSCIPGPGCHAALRVPRHFHFIFPARDNVAPA